MRAAMPWLVMTKKPSRPLSENTGAAGSPSTKDRCCNATLMTSEPFGRVSFSNETSAEREISVMPSVLKSSPRVRAWPDAAMMRLESLIETLPTSRPVVPKLAVKSTTGGAVADADEGMHVLGADGQDVDHLGRAWGAGQVHRHRIREAREREAAADVDEVVDDERHVAEGAHYAARRIEHHVRRHAALLGPGRDGERRDAEVDRAPAARAVYFDAEMIGAQRDAGDADDRDAAARLERVVARMVGGAGRLEQRQAELDVMQREAHRAVGMHAAVGVEIRPAHADEGIDA